MYPCPCCGYEVFGEPPGSYDICPICFWEDDIVQLAFPDLAGGANACSLMEGQRNFEVLGACEAAFCANVRAPSAGDRKAAKWRFLDPRVDRYLKWNIPEDNELWQNVMDAKRPCLYYWLPEYWLNKTL
jgi:hypothetical protein